MGKNKLSRFKELEQLDRVFQPPFEDIFSKDYFLKGHWKQHVFKNYNPLILELGCGKGEYTTGLAELDPDKNFIGVDIKGARLWKGAKYAHENNLFNVAFLRTRIEFIQSFFNKDEVDEIWLTFPDPQIKKRRNKKRLTSSGFLNAYRSFLVNNGIIHLKTDSEHLFHYTVDLVEFNKLEMISKTDNLYRSGNPEKFLSIRTFYESQYIQEGKKINYLAFHLPSHNEIVEPRGNDE